MNLVDLVESGDLPGLTCEQAKEAVYLTNRPRSSERYNPIRLLLQFNLFSRLDIEMLKHILGEGNLAPCGDGQSAHCLSLLPPDAKIVQEALYVITNITPSSVHASDRWMLRAWRVRSPLSQRQPRAAIY